MKIIKNESFLQSICRVAPGLLIKDDLKTNAQAIHARVTTVAGAATIVDTTTGLENLIEYVARRPVVPPIAAKITTTKVA
jgi:hypothetical protein